MLPPGGTDMPGGARMFMCGGTEGVPAKTRSPATPAARSASHSSCGLRTLSCSRIRLSGSVPHTPEPWRSR